MYLVTYRFVQQKKKDYFYGDISMRFQGTPIFLPLPIIFFTVNIGLLG